MFKNYILVAVRNLLRHKLISCINIIGLATSMSVGLLVLNIVKNAFDVDSFHPEPNRTYRIITQEILKSGDSEYFAASPYVLADYLKDHYSFVEHATRIVNDVDEPVKIQATAEEFSARSVFADPEFFNVFGLKLSEGNPLRALNAPYTAVISEKASGKLFGKQSAIGKTLFMGKYGEFVVTGIFQKPILPSRVDHEIYLSMSTLSSLIQARKISFSAGWDDVYKTHTYIMMKKGSSEEELNTALRHAANFAKHNSTLDQSIDHREFKAQSLPDLVYSPPMYFESAGAETIPYEALGLAMLMLLLAAFNYMNLTIAKIFSRVKEIGIRKVSGATRNHIMVQFITEAVLIALISFCLATLLTKLLPVTDKISIVAMQRFDLTLFAWFFLFAIAVGLVCGVFPAVVLSKIKLTSALKNKIVQGEVRTPLWQRALIVIQFSISLLFITISLTMIGQTKLIKTADYGISKSDIINIRLPSADVQHFKNIFSQETGVQLVSSSSGRPVFSTPLECWVPYKTDSVKSIYFAADENYIPIYGLSIIAGENFSNATLSNNETSALINEECVTRLGFKTPYDAIGESITVDDSISLKITGVIRNFHPEGLKQPIKPFLIRYLSSAFNMISVKTQSGQIESVIARIQQISKKANRDYQLEYAVFENDFQNDKFVKSNDLKLIIYLSFITVLISSLGLIGIVMFNARARVGEIGIRKVMGASVGEITILLSRKFVVLLLIACCLSLPFCYIICNAILEDYAYKFDLGIPLYVLSVVILIAIGLIVICSQTLYAAMQNPTKTIRSE